MADEADDIVTPLARSFLREDFDAIDPRLNGWLEMLTQVGSNECWHKRSTFKAHLYHTYQMLKMWGQDDTLCSCMLFHSAYSNSYVDLAIVPRTDREKLQGVVGNEAEMLYNMDKEEDLVTIQDWTI
eukprot:gene21805-28826_t